MSRQNPFARGTGDRFCNNCQSGAQNNCHDPQFCCEECDGCHSKDKNPCVVCPPGPEGPQGPEGPRGPIGPQGPAGDGASEVLPMTAAEYDALTTAQKQALYEEGYRVLAVEDGIDELPEPLDASLLGGKAPAYYLPVRELLDNCAFDIAQAGIDGKHGNYQYVADRWIAETVANAVIVSEKSGDVMTISNTGTAATSILQRTTIEWLDQFVGQTVTLAVCLADGTIRCKAGTVPEIPTSNSKNTCVIYLSGVKISLTRFKTEQQLVRMTIQPGSSISVKWIRLVLGEYTAETLPPYIPRSYEAELAACQRYFVQYESNTAYSDIAVGLSNADAGGAYFPIHFPVPMRKAPSIWYNDINLFKIYTPMVSPSNLTVYSSESSESGCKHQLIRANISGLGLAASTAYMLNMTTGAILQFIADP